MNIIVTGASRGIGYEVAAQFTANRNNTVLVISRNEERLMALKQECMEASPEAKLLVLPFDLENLEGIEGYLRDNILKHFSSLDVLINNAGPVSPVNAQQILRLSPDQTDRRGSKKIIFSDDHFIQVKHFLQKDKVRVIESPLNQSTLSFA
ncbi:hypothetical protein ES705_47695 [subsurface metagenome]